MMTSCGGTGWATKSDDTLSRSLVWFEGCKHSPIGFRPRRRIGSDFRGLETQRAESFRELDRARDPVDDGKPMPFRQTCGEVGHAGAAEHDHFGTVLSLGKFDFGADLC